MPQPPQIILHHYPLSPFSEKIRAMFGYTGMKWQSVLTREMPPRPLLQPLAGDYRRIPVAQIGADVFCDTRLISEEIALLTGQPDLDFYRLDDAQQAFIAHTDFKVFFASVMTASGKALNRKAMQSLSLADLMKLVWDRLNMGRKARVRLAGRDSKGVVHAHLQDMEQRLSQPFLFGATPTHADFSAYHSLWFLVDLGEKPVLTAFPQVAAWMGRMRAFGTGECTEIAGTAAWDAAREAAPRAIASEDTVDSLIGEQVSIAPADYGLNPTRGQLVGSTPTRWIISREQAQVGTVHVHFPKKGYALSVL